MRRNIILLGPMPCRLGGECRMAMPAVQKGGRYSDPLVSVCARRAILVHLCKKCASVLPLQCNFISAYIHFKSSTRMVCRAVPDTAQP